MNGLRIQNFNLKSVIKREISLNLWLPTQRPSDPGAKPRLMVTMAEGQIVGIWGLGARLSAADKAMAINILHSRQAALNAAFDAFATTTMPRGRLGRLPFRLHSLSAYARDGSPTLGPDGGATFVLYPMIAGLGTVELHLPAGSSALVAWLETPEFREYYRRVLTSQAGVGPLRNDDLVVCVHWPISTAEPALRAQWAAGSISHPGPPKKSAHPAGQVVKTPSGMTMSAAFVVEGIKLGPAVRHFIGAMVNALA
jgi:hypothetical protein